MMIIKRLATALCMVLWASAAEAQSSSWVQIEARPSEAQARERAEFWSGSLPDVQGYRLSSGWYGVALGPYSEAEALNVLDQLRLSARIPRDSFISDGATYRTQFFSGAPSANSTLTPAPAPVVLEAGEETVQEARRNERLLSREERALIQTALKWEGVYTSTIDADFGPGTRRAMSGWQEANGFEPTGVMTTRQRGTLLEAYQSAVAALSMTPTVESLAGVSLDLPLGMVAFDRYEPPFAHFRSTTDDDVQVILISQRGDRGTLRSLYDVMQTLEIIPLEGRRALRRNDFTIAGNDGDTISHSFAQLSGDEIKGFTLVWPADDAKRQRLALSAMQASFETLDGVLPDNAGSGSQDIDFLAGLQIRRPVRARSGFYVDARGGVLTTDLAVQQCTRVTIGDDVEMVVAATDGDLGLAYLQPGQSLAPLAIAELAAQEPRLQSDVAVSGYSFGGVLQAPSLTYGVFSDVKGLDGDMRVQRLEIPAEAGDAGGPVFEASGKVMGVLLDTAEGARKLPGNVAFALDASVVAEFLAANGVATAAGAAADGLAPEDLTLLAADMTVLVNCWN